VILPSSEQSLAMRGWSISNARSLCNSHRAKHKRREPLSHVRRPFRWRYTVRIVWIVGTTCGALRRGEMRATLNFDEVMAWFRAAI
jgi:hypothetical protein